MGPVTARQFVILLVTALVDGIAYGIFDKMLWIIATLPIAGIGLTIAFVKVNGQQFHYFFLNFTAYMRRAKLRVWRKGYTDAELRALAIRALAPPTVVVAHKDFVQKSRLSELALVVNTGGVYRSEAQDDLS